MPWIVFPFVEQPCRKEEFSHAYRLFCLRLLPGLPFNHKKKKCIYTSGRWKSHIHLSMRAEIFAALALTALRAPFQIAEGKGTALRREFYCRDEEVSIREG